MTILSIESARLKEQITKIINATKSYEDDKDSLHKIGVFIHNPPKYFMLNYLWDKLVLLVRMACTGENSYKQTLDSLYELEKEILEVYKISNVTEVK